ncbi:MAG: ribonuclease P protein component [Candidatus Pacebacteria bacterium]|nr:ribonuclease P protein component [Candidatus Paceibacterota bacterium]
MLPKKLRLTKKEIEEHLLRAKRTKTPLFTFSYLILPNSNGPKISVSVSKKVASKAVVRNKLRRRAYSALKPLIPCLNEGTLGLVTYSSTDTQKPISDLTNEFKKAFEGLKILKK